MESNKQGVMVDSEKNESSQKKELRSKSSTNSPKVIPEHSKAGLAKMNSNKPLVAKNITPAYVLDRYEQGLTMAQVAEEIGLSGSEQLYRLLIAEAPEQWKEYQSARALRRLEEATVGLETGSDGLSVARNRERIKSAQWELEKLMRRIYGQDMQQNVSSNIQINIGIAKEHVIDIQHVGGGHDKN